MTDPQPFLFRQRQQEALFLVYRRRVIHRGSTPNDPSRHDVICAAFWEEQQVKDLEKQATDRGYELWWETVPVHSPACPEQHNATVFVVFEGGLAQDHPEALEFSDPVGLAVYFTRNDVEAALESHTDWEWEDVWELPVPWQSAFALNPFTKKRSSGSPEDYEFTL